MNLQYLLEGWRAGDRVCFYNSKENEESNILTTAQNYQEAIENHSPRVHYETKAYEVWTIAHEIATYFNGFEDEGLDAGIFSHLPPEMLIHIGTYLEKIPSDWIRVLELGRAIAGDDEEKNIIERELNLKNPNDFLLLTHILDRGRHHLDEENKAAGIPDAEIYEDENSMNDNENDACAEAFDEMMERRDDR